MLLVKQLIYFERYGKLYLGDRPLIWDTDVYRALLALPEDDTDAVARSPTSRRPGGGWRTAWSRTSGCGGWRSTAAGW